MTYGMVTVLCLFGPSALAAFLVYVYYCKKQKSFKQHGSPYDPHLFLRQRNNGTYFVDIRTFKSQDIHWGEQFHVSYSYNWRQVEAGTTQQEADTVMARLTAELKADKDLKESLKYETLREESI